MHAGTEFGKAATAYASGRKGYPQGFYDFIQTKIAADAAILELGCGTGVATRELRDRGFCKIIATDIDPLMLEQAKALCPDATFLCASARSLPFAEGQFDALFAFGCFHWFCNTESIEEIKRVLKPRGIFVVVNKKDIGTLREEFSLFLTQLVGRAFPEPKASYGPVEALASHNFAVSTESWDITETFTAEELLNFCQSTSLWNSLSQPERVLHLPALEQFVQMRLQDGAFVRPVRVDALIAIKAFS